MADLQFDEEQYSRSNNSENKKSAMVRLLMNMGLVSEESAANIVLIIIAIIFFAISAFIFFR